MHLELTAGPQPLVSSLQLIEVWQYSKEIKKDDVQQMQIC